MGNITQGSGQEAKIVGGTAKCFISLESHLSYTQIGLIVLVSDHFATLWTICIQIILYM